MITDALTNSPVLRHDMELEFHRLFVDRLSHMMSFPIESIPRYEDAHYVPLELFDQIHLYPYVGNHHRWGIDGDTSALIREHGYHSSGQDVLFWSVPLARRAECFVETGGGDDVVERCVPASHPQTS